MFEFAGLLSGFVCWLMGAGLFVLSQRWNKRSSVLTRMMWGISLGVLVICLLLTRVAPLLRYADYLVASATVFFLFATMLAYICPPMRWTPIARFGARSSYSLYVIHYPFMIFAIGLLCRHARLPPSIASLSSMAGVAFAAIGLALAFSWITEWKTSAVRNWIECKFTTCGITVRAVRER